MIINCRKHNLQEQTLGEQLYDGLQDNELCDASHLSCVSSLLH
jgi:hypothetical protein